MTTTDREFLTGEKEYTGDHAKQSRYQRREGIAKRTRAAFADFALLYEQLDEAERNRIFDIEPIDEDPDQYNELQGALASTIAFLYRSLEGEIHNDAVDRRAFRVPFEDVFIEGVKRGEADRRDQDSVRKHRVDVDYGGVDVVEVGNPASLERAVRKIATHRHHELTEGEMASIIWHFEPDGVSDMLTGEREGFGRLDDRIDELRDELGVESFGEYDDE